MDMSKYMGESTAYDKKLMLERKEPLKRSGDSLPSSHKRANFAFETLRVEYFARAKLKFVESDFDSFGLVEGGGLLTEALDDDEFSGGLLNLLDAAKGFVKVSAKIKWQKIEDGSGRVEYPEWPSAAMEEAIVNGLMHRDYLEIGSEVHIDMFDDRLEVYSPGDMVSCELIQSLDTRAVASKCRNPVIADSFQRLSLMERRGSGFGKIPIVELCRKTRLSTSGVHKTISALKKASKIRRIGLTKGGYWEVGE